MVFAHTGGAYLLLLDEPLHGDSGLGNAIAQLIDGAEYATAGVRAIADLQELGYECVQP